MTGIPGTNGDELAFEQLGLGSWITTLDPDAAALPEFVLEDLMAEPARPQEAAPHAAAPAPPDDVVTRFGATLSKLLTEACVEAFRAIEAHHAAEGRAIRDAMRQEQEKLESVAESLKGLTAAVTSLHQAHTSQESQLAALSQRTSELSVSITNRLDSQQQELSALNVTASDTSSRVAALVERLDRHARVIHAVSESQTLGEAALDQFVEIWARLKASAGQLSMVSKDPL